jgi:hypothetical protein
VITPEENQKSRALGVEESAVVSETLTFHSPLPVDEVRRRLNDRTMNASLGSWVEVAGGGPELFGQVRGRRVRLERPHVMNDAAQALVGTLGVAEDGGTILTAEVRHSFGWPPSHSHSVEDIEYVVQALDRIAKLAKTPDK